MPAPYPLIAALPVTLRPVPAPPAPGRRPRRAAAWWAMPLPLIMAALAACGGGDEADARADASDAALAALAVSSGRVTTTIAADGGAQRAEIPAGVASVQVTPTARAAGATITVQGERVASGQPSTPIPLAGRSTVVTIVVIAPDGSTGRSTTLRLQRSTSR